MKYSFDDFVLDTDRHELLFNGQIVSVEPQVFALLELLISSNGRLISRDEIISKIWKDRIISEAAIDSRVRSARQALNDSGKTQTYIKTIRGKGLRFLADVEQGGDAAQKAQKTSKFKVYRTAIITVLVLLSFVALGFWMSDDAKENQLATSSHEKSMSMSIAVMPFLYMSDAQNQEYLAHGLSEEILNLLAGVDTVKVASRTSAFKLNDTKASIADIGTILNVSHVLEGSVRMSGNQTRVTAQLIETKTDTHVWSKTYDQVFEAGELFTLQDSIAELIVRDVIGDDEVKDPRYVRGTQSIPAHEAYLRGEALKRKATLKGLWLAEKEYSKAISSDPKFAQAYAGRAHVYINILKYGEDDPESLLDFIQSDIERAKKLNPNDVEILTVSARLEAGLGNYKRAIKLTEKAIKQDPNHAPAYAYQAMALLELGQHKLAIRLLEQARMLDPLSPEILNVLSDSLLLVGDLDEAFSVAKDNYKWNPRNSEAYEALFFLNIQRADYAAAYAIIEEALRVDPKRLELQYELVRLYSFLGMEAEALAVSSHPLLKSWAHIYAGQKDLALQYEKMIAEEYTNSDLLLRLKEFARVKPFYDEQVEDEDIMADGVVPVGEGDIYLEACWLYTHLQDKKAQPICSKVSQFYQNKSPEDYIRISDIASGAGWHLLEGRSDEAKEWLQYLVDQGHVDMTILKNPLYEALAQHPNIEKFMADMTRNATYHQQLINSQKTSNPKFK